MKIISLTKGKETIIDDDDFERINKNSWYFNKIGYAMRGIFINKKLHQIYLHRVILNLNIGDKKYVDHINHNKLDNRKINLRIVTQQQNCFNRIKNKNNTSGITGIYWDKSHKKWESSIKYKYKKIFLGYFNNKYDAIFSRNKAENKYFKK